MPEKTLHLDIETRSDVDLSKAGVYPYSESPKAEILLVAAAIDDDEIQCFDLASGETLPKWFIAALTDPSYIKVAHNAAFERVCFSRYLYGSTSYHFLDPSQWHCTMVHAAMLGLPFSLDGVAQVLGTGEQKDKAGADLIKYFCAPCKPTKTNGGRTWNEPSDAPEKWEAFKDYCIQDVATERDIYNRLQRFPIPQSEADVYVLDQQINDRGVLIDLQMVEQAIQAKYCGAPGFAYEVGGLRIDRDGTVSGPDNRGLIADLEGLYSLVPTEKAYDTEKPAPVENGLEPRYTEEELGLGLHRRDPIGEDGMQADDVPDAAPCSLTISLPREGMTDAAIENLRRLIANKEILIKKALGLDSLPIEADDNVISFPWYDKMPTSEVVKAASTLVSKLVGMAKNQKRVNAKAEEPVENMKYSFRCLLLRLGFIGPEYKDVRSTLLKNFSGSGAFKSGARRTGPRPAVPLDQPIDVQASEREDSSNA